MVIASALTAILDAGGVLSDRRREWTPLPVSLFARLPHGRLQLSCSGEEDDGSVVHSRFVARVRHRVADIPVFGSIPAGVPQDRTQEAKGCLSIDIGTLNFKPTARTFALEVRGDSMVGKHIVDGDLVILEHGANPKPGDVVAALIDGESTLKTFLLRGSKPYLKAENPKFPDLIPAQELVIQGVLKLVIRRAR